MHLFPKHCGQKGTLRGVNGSFSSISRQVIKVDRVSLFLGSQVTKMIRFSIFPGSRVTSMLRFPIFPGLPLTYLLPLEIFNLFTTAYR